MNANSYQIFRNRLYKQLVDANLIIDNDDNYQKFDTILGESPELDVDWSDDTKPSFIHMDGGMQDLSDIAMRVAKLDGTRNILVVGHTDIGSVATERNVHDFSAILDAMPVMSIRDNKLNDDMDFNHLYIDYNDKGSKFIKPNNTKNWKK